MSHNAHIVMDFNEAEGSFNIEAHGNQLGKMLCFALGAAHLLHKSALDQTGKEAIILAIAEQTREELKELEAADDGTE